MKLNRRKKETSLEDTKLYDKVTQLQTLIIEKLASLRRSNRSLACSHLLDMEQEAQIYNPQENYYQKFWKLFLMTQMCREKIKICEEYNQYWESQLKKVEFTFEKLEQVKQANNYTKNKNRRKASDIQKNYECQHEGCFKSYGTEPALRLHQKQKHQNQRIK